MPSLTRRCTALLLVLAATPWPASGLGHQPGKDERLSKATDVCARDPERVARFLVDNGYAERYDYAAQALVHRHPAGAAMAGKVAFILGEAGSHMTVARRRRLQ